jgi:hypothetical protein
MLTLKVITTDVDGDKSVTLFSSDHISHSEINEIRKDISDKYPCSVRVGILADSSSEQKLVVSHVLFYNTDNSIKGDILILPKSDCFIMDEGRTVDTFYSYFKE